MVAIQDVLSGLLKIFISFFLGVVAVNISISLIDRLTRDVDEWAEIKKGNIAIALFLSSAILSTAYLAESSIDSMLSVFVAGISGKLLIIYLLAAVAQTALTLLVAVFFIYLIIRVIDALTVGIDEFQELRKGNVAVGLVMAVMMFSIAFVIKLPVDQFVGSLDISGFFGSLV